MYTAPDINAQWIAGGKKVEEQPRPENAGGLAHLQKYEDAQPAGNQIKMEKNDQNGNNNRGGRQWPAESTNPGRP